MPTLRDLPRIDSSGRASAGSQKQIQMYVNERPQELGAAIGESLLWYGLEVKDIQWVSPLAEESYLQYRDSEFLQRVGLGSLAPELQDYWPQGGPCWDALARIEGGCILIEAKSHVAELYGGGCKASPENMGKILEALDETKSWLGVSSNVDWMGRLYPFANRYASLHFLREIAGVRAFLMDVYFLNDPVRRTTRKEWDDAIESVNRELGIKSEVPYSAACFLKAE